MEDIDEESNELKDTLSNAETVEKYKAAAEIANRALAHVASLCKPDSGKFIYEICQEGDNFIEEQIKAVYKRQAKLEKGLAFPTCISVNNVIGHYSPLAEDQSVLKEGDIVKIDLGVHVDGFIANVAHTIVATNDAQQAVTGRKADVICAAHFAGEIALRLLRPGNTNTQISEAIGQVAASFNCTPVEGVLSHQLKRFVLDGNNTIINKPSLEQQVAEFTIEDGQVYSLDIVMSTGEGKPQDRDIRTTVFKRVVDQNYSLKMKASRYLFSEINTRYPSLGFNLRAFDENRGKLGIKELVSHDLVQPFPVLFEKDGEFVAQFKFTVLILPSSIQKLTAFDLPFVNSEHKLTDPKLNQILAMGLKRKTNAKKKKKKAPAKPAAVEG